MKLVGFLAVSALLRFASSLRCYVCHDDIQCQMPTDTIECPNVNMGFVGNANCYRFFVKNTVYERGCGSCESVFSTCDVCQSDLCNGHNNIAETPDSPDTRTLSFDKNHTAQFVHDFKANLSAIIDITDNQCLIMDMEHNMTSSVAAFVDVVWSNGYDQYSADIVDQDNSVGKKLTPREMSGLKSHMVKRLCKHRVSYKFQSESSITTNHTCNRSELPMFGPDRTVQLVHDFVRNFTAIVDKVGYQCYILPITKANGVALLGNNLDWIRRRYKVGAKLHLSELKQLRSRMIKHKCHHRTTFMMEKNEKSEIPAFGSKQLFRSIHDFKMNTTAAVDVSGGQCFVMSLDHEKISAPSDMTDLARKMQAGAYDIDTDELKMNYRLVKQINLSDIDSPTIRQNCKHKIIYKLEKRDYLV